MRKIALLLAFAGFCFVFHISGATIVEWNFNSTSPDSDVSTGSFLPSDGEGTLTLFGGVNSTFGSVGGGATSDPAGSDNTQVRVTRLPSIAEGNKASGVELTFATHGLEDLRLRWDQYNSATASRFWRVQWTRDGFEWLDHAVVTNSTASTWARRDVSFENVPEVNDRPYLSVRITPEFESTATGAGLDAYAAVKDGSTYSAAGSWWLDQITITGRTIGTTNVPPAIDPVPDVSLAEGSDSEPIAFGVSDSETSSSSIMITALSSDTNVITRLTLGGEGTNRSVTLRPGSAGTATVTIRATDEEGAFAEINFNVLVLSRISDQPFPTNIISLWDFNSSVPDADPSTGTLSPATGAGSLNVIGTDNFQFGSVGQSRTSDPEALDNSMLRIGSFPAQGTGNKTAGVLVFISTVGQRHISLVWDHYNSASASRFWRVQFTTNGTDFIDHTLVTNSTASTWTRRRTVSFGEIPGVANNAHFGVRIVSEFGPEEAFVAVGSTSTYSAAGTLWIDMLAIIGDHSGNEAPELTVALGSLVKISWSAALRDRFVLESRATVEVGWRPQEAIPIELEGRLQVELPAEGGARYFRLREITAP